MLDSEFLASLPALASCFDINSTWVLGVYKHKQWLPGCIARRVSYAGTAVSAGAVQLEQLSRHAIQVDVLTSNVATANTMQAVRLQVLDPNSHYDEDALAMTRSDRHDSEAAPLATSGSRQPSLDQHDGATRRRARQRQRRTAHEPVAARAVSGAEQRCRGVVRRGAAWRPSSLAWQPRGARNVADAAPQKRRPCRKCCSGQLWRSRRVSAPWADPWCTTAAQRRRPSGNARGY